MDSFYDTDDTGRVTRVYYECEEAREHLRASDGARIVLNGTTHGTNRHGMKLGCFTGVDNNWRTILLAVSLLVNEDDASFKWAFSRFAESFSVSPDVMFTDGDRAMAAALNVTLPELMQAAKAIAEEGRETHLAYTAALAGIEKLVDELRRMNSGPRPVGRPPSSTDDVVQSRGTIAPLNPRKKQKGPGRHATKRKGAP